jgi:gliding motility-associated-like protein
MKKIILVFLLSFVAITASAQFIAGGTGHAIQLTGSNVYDIDAVFLFNGITADNTIQYTGSGNSFVWTKYDNTFMSNQAAVSVEDGTGYILTVDGSTRYYVWVIDYQKYPVTASSLTPVEGADKCSSLGLSFGGSIPELVYFNKDNNRETLPRTFTLTYEDQEYANSAWAPKNASATFTAPLVMTVDAPLKDAVFTLKGDQYATQFGLNPVSVSSSTYSAVRVEQHLAGAIEERNAQNEIQRIEVSSSSKLEGSGPLVVSFKSNANTPVAKYYLWTIINTQTSATIQYNDVDLMNYTFNQSGVYKVALRVTNSTNSCFDQDTITVVVSDSKLKVPNVFTPNGDGKNDEFRVAYHSIAKFQMLLYSSWAGRVYSSDDPSQGWDGRVNGKLAPPGVYYYIVTATGTDGKAYKLKGSVTLLRSKKDK